MSNYIARPLTEVPDYLVKTISVPSGVTLYAGQVVLLNGLDTTISGNYTVFTPSQVATATIGTPAAIIINGGFEKLSDGRRPAGQPDYTQYTYTAGDVATVILLDHGMEFEISNDSINLNSLTPTAGQVLYPVNAAYVLTLGTAVPAGTFSNFTVLATKYFRLGGQFGGQFASTIVVMVNSPKAAA